MAINVDISKITGINQVGNSYQRKSAVPLDYYSYFNTKVDAETYAASNPVSYVGQIIAYSHEGKVVTCVIADAAGTLREIEKPIAGQLIAVGADNSVNHAEIDEAPWVEYVALSQHDEDTWVIGQYNAQDIIKVEAINPNNEYTDITDSVQWGILGDVEAGEIFAYVTKDGDWDNPRALVRGGSHDFIADLLFDGHGHVIGKFGEQLPEQKVYTGDNKTITIEEDGTIRLFGTSEEAPPEGGQILSWNSDSETLQWIDPVEDTDTDTNTTYSFEFDKTEQKIKIGVSTTEKGEVTSSNTEELDLSDFLTADELPEDKDTTYSVKEGEKVLKLENTVFSTELGLKHENGKISLTGIGGEVIAEFSDAEFVADGVLEDVSYDDKTKNLTFTWNIVTGTDPDGKPIYKTDVVNIADLIDTYTAGNGIDLNNAEFSIKLHNETESFLSLEDETINGVTKKRIKLSGVQDAIDAAIESVQLYTDGNGIDFTHTDDEDSTVIVEMKLHEDTEEEFLSLDVSADGKRRLKLSGVQDAIDAALEAAKDYADELPHEDTLYTLSDGTPETEGDVKLILTPSEGDAQEVDVKAYNKAKIDKMLYEGSYKKGNETIPSNIAADDKANSRLISPAEMAKLAALVLSEDGTVGVSGTIEAANVKNLGEAIASKVTGATSSNGLGIEAGAEVNIIETVKVNDTALTPDENRAVNITVPTKLSDLTDDITHVKAVKMKEAVTDGYQPKLIVSQIGNNVTIDDSALQADTADVKRVADTAVQSAEFAGKTLTKNGTKVSITKEEAVEALGLKALAFTESIDTGVHAVSLTSGTNSGTVKLIVDGTPTDNIAVTGLKSAAYTEATDYDIAGAAATAKSEVLGKSTDAAGAATVHGALNKAAEVLGTEADGATAKTVYGAHAAVVALQNGAVKSNADAIAKLAEDIGNVSNIMNFRGVVAHKEGNSLSQDVAEAGISDLKDGDVIIYGEKEYVYQGGAWHEFGDASGNASAIQALDERVDGIEERVGVLETRKASNTQYGMVKGTANTTVDGVTTGTGVHIEEGMVKTVSMDLLINGDFEIIFCAGGAQ